MSVADDQTQAEYERTGTVPVLSQTVGRAPGSRRSEALSEAGREAAAAGRTGDAYVYHDLAISTAQVEVAMEQVQASANLLTSYVDAMNALASLAPVFAHSSARDIAGWVRRETGCIGDSAPPGSFVHLDINRVSYATAFTATSRTDYQVTAVLDDGGGQRTRAERGFPVVVSSGDAPPAEVGPDGVTAVPGRDAPAVGSVSHPFDQYLTIAANSALAELDRRVGEGR